jgi:hypothetical protein
MTQRESVPQGAVCWLDLWTSDVEGSRQFYSDLFGWFAAEPSEEFGGYWMFLREGVPVAGGMGDMGDMKANDTWKIFLAAHDINDVVAKGEELGAQFFMPPMPVADMGIQTVFTDANGATLGAWQPLSFPGFMTTDEPGTPCWFELNARDFAAAVNFYTSVFALGTKVMADSDDFRYTTLVADGHEVAGILDASGRLPEGVASHWVIYWQVDDIDAAVARVRELGGAVHDGPFDSLFGRIATVADPTGSMFKLRSSSSE